MARLSRSVPLVMLLPWLAIILPGLAIVFILLSLATERFTNWEGVKNIDWMMLGAWLVILGCLFIMLWGVCQLAPKATPPPTQLESK